MDKEKSENNLLTKRKVKKNPPKRRDKNPPDKEWKKKARKNPIVKERQKTE